MRRLFNFVFPLLLALCGVLFATNGEVRRRTISDNGKMIYWNVRYGEAYSAVLLDNETVIRVEGVPVATDGLRVVRVQHRWVGESYYAYPPGL